MSKLSHALSIPALLAFAVLAMAPGKCQPAPLPEEPLCDGPKDCEGLIHPDCAGAWTCTDDATCLWECKVEPPTCDTTCAKGESCQCAETCDSSGCWTSCSCIPDQPLPLCWADSDCKAGEACVCTGNCVGGGGKVPPIPCLMECFCQPQGCVADKECGEGCSCIGGACSCDPGPSMCWWDGDCKEGCWCDMSAAPCLVAPCWGQCKCDKPTSCVVSGCSGQICAPEPMFSTCEWNPVYACYKLTSCGATADGGCGWASNPAFDECVKSGGMSIQ
ncbi:MAG: hypothetical protein AMXMBFR64_32190 [Myxococcales bacterium]